jgi:putative transposase
MDNEHVPPLPPGSTSPPRLRRLAAASKRVQCAFALHHFFTVNLLDRKSRLLIERIGVLRKAVARVRTLMPFYSEAWVVLPEHMHRLWTLPEGDGNLPKRWQAIKTAFSRSVTPGEALSTSRRVRESVASGNGAIGSTRCAANGITHRIRIIFNPVKHGLAARAAEWEFSSFQRCVRQGLYPADWSSIHDTLAEWGKRR